MIKQMNGWKLLSHGRFSFNYPQMYSDYEGLRLYYPIVARVYPTIPGSMLFFFDNKVDAVNFADSYKASYIVVPCVAYGCKRIKILSDGCNINGIKEFWQNKKAKRKVGKAYYSKIAPKGTWIAESIMCME